VTQQINQALDVIGHFLFVLGLFQVFKIHVWESMLEELDVELVREEDGYVVYPLICSHICQNFIAKV